MKRRIKVTIADFKKIEENLHNPAEVQLYRDVNGMLFDAELEHDGYAVIDVNDNEYLELAPDEYELMIEEWKATGKAGDYTIETKSDPSDDKALLYRLIDDAGNEMEAPKSLPKQILKQLAQAWFGTGKKQENENSDNLS